jgi:uncharacterized membrane protein
MRARFALVVRAATAIASLALFHAAIVTNKALYNVAALVFLLAAALARGVHGGRGRLILAGGLGAIAVALFLSPHITATLAHGLPLLVNLALMIYFGRTLLPNREPLITRFCRVEYGGRVPDAFVRYTRMLTLIWTALFAVFAAECAVPFAVPSMLSWLVPLNLLNGGIVALFFLGEHVFRTWRFPSFGVASPLRTGRIILLAGRHHD